MKKRKRGSGKPVISVLLLCLLLAVLAGCQVGRKQPQARHGAKMVYDPVGKQVLLFGGRGAGSAVGDLYNDIWALDLERQTWEKLESSSGPEPRLSPGLVYDPSHHQLILFGGYQNPGRVNDTWLFDLDSNEWREVIPPVSPPARSDMGMAFNEKKQVVLLFGGYCLDFERDQCDDTWSFDPATNEWMELDPVSSPPVMYGHSLEYDLQEDTFVIFGGHISDFSQGSASSAGYNGSVWSYSLDENQWVEMPRGGQMSPLPRYWHQAAYIPSEGGLMVFGGDSGYTYLADSWFFASDTASWSRKRTEGSPPARIVGTMVYGPDHDQLILFGGLDKEFENLNDTWIYTVSRASWEQINP